tara:strand:+ start:499 stop:2625 length:2127 start_codon:yes stop_codon:yes gene_type:complete
MAGKIFVDEIRKTGRTNAPMEILGTGVTQTAASVTVQNFGTSASVYLDLSLANYFVLFMRDCTSNVKEMKFLNTSNQSFNSFVLEVHQTDSGTARQIEWNLINNVKWSHGVAPNLSPNYSHVDVYSFMNRGGYVYLTLENDANRQLDLDYAFKLQDVEDTVATTFNLFHVNSMITGFEKPWYQTFEDDRSTFYPSTSSWLPASSNRIPEGNQVGDANFNFGYADNPWRKNQSITFPQTAPLDKMYPDEPDKPAEIGIIHQSSGFPSWETYQQATTAGVSGELASFSTPTELVPLFSSGTSTSGYVDGTQDKRDILLWDPTFPNLAISNTQGYYNPNDVTIDFTTGVGWDIDNWELNFSADGQGYRQASQGSVATEDGDGSYTGASLTPGIGDSTTTWQSYGFDHKKIHLNYYYQKDHSTKMISSGSGTNLSIFTEIFGSATINIDGALYGPSFKILVHYPGENWAVGDTLTIKGSLFGATDGTHDIILRCGATAGSIDTINIVSGGSAYSVGQWVTFHSKITADTGGNNFVKRNLFSVDNTILSDGYAAKDNLCLKITSVADSIKMTATDSGGTTTTKNNANGGETNPNFSLTKGRTYIFDFSDSSYAGSSGHEFYFSEYLNGDNGGGHNSASAYLTGITYSTEVPGTSGSKITFIVSDDAPSTLYYYNINTSGITGTISVFNQSEGPDYLMLETSNVYASVVGQNFS